MIDLMKSTVVTEKSRFMADLNKITFLVDLRLSKPQIKRLIEKLWTRGVVSVNTLRPPRKRKRFGFSQGFKTSYKKVIVTIK